MTRRHPAKTTPKPRRGLLAALVALLCATAALAALAGSASAAVTFCPKGAEAGHCEASLGVAVNQTGAGGVPAGTLYLADESNHRIDEFSPAEQFARAWGWGVRDGGAEFQTCTTATGCTRGLADHSIEGEKGIGAGETRPVAVAVQQSTGDVFVSEVLGYRVQKFGPEGEFLLMFGRDVNKTKSEPGSLASQEEKDLCTEFEVTIDKVECQQGARGAGPGAIENPMPRIAVDSSGDVWVGDASRLERFGPEGEPISEVKLPEIGELSALAIDSSGDFYTLTPSRNGEQLLTPPAAGTYTLTFKGQTTAPIPASAGRPEIQAALAALPAIGPGNVFLMEHAGTIADVAFAGALAETDVPQLEASAGSVETVQDGSADKLRKFGPAGELLEVLDAAGHPQALGLDPVSDELYVSDQISTLGTDTLLRFAPSGEQTQAFATGEVAGNPAGDALAFGDTAGRLYATDGVAQSFAPPPPGPLVEFASTTASPLRKTTATLVARVNPEDRATEYRFQYVDQQDFEEEGGFAGPKVKTTPLTPLEGEADFAFHKASAEITGLVPATTYRVRVVAANERATTEGERDEAGDEIPRTFTTLPPAAIDSTSVADVTADSATLQGEVNPLGDATTYHFQYLTEAALKRNEAAGYPPFEGAAQAPLEEAPLGSGEADVAISQHLQGLQTHTAYRYRIVAHNALGTEEGQERAFTTQAPAVAALPDGRRWELVSPPDKHGALIEASNTNYGQAAAAGGVVTYVASAPTETSPAGSPHETQVLSTRASGGGWSSRDIAIPHRAATSIGPIGFGQEYRVFSPDLSRAIVQPYGVFEPAISPAASEETVFLRTDFPPGDPANPCTESCYRPLVTGCPKEEAEEACPPAVQALADVPPGTVFADRGKCTISEIRPICLGPFYAAASPDLAHIVLESPSAFGINNTPDPLTADSADHGGLYEFSAAAPPGEALRFASILPGGEAATGAVSPGGPNPISADGSRLLFYSGGGTHGEGEARPLYLRDMGRGETIQIGAGKERFEAANSQDSLVFYSGQECEVKLNAESKLECAALGADGSLHAISEDGAIAYFSSEAALTGAEANEAGETAQSGKPNLYVRQSGVTRFIATTSFAHSRPSPDGRWFAFDTTAPLSGYDNTGPTCVPTTDVIGKVIGYTPGSCSEVYLYDAQANSLRCVSCNPTGARPLGPSALPQSAAAGRSVSDSGRVFFDSSDALLPTDTNGTQDVYEFEPPGVGSCGEASPLFFVSSGGCLGLISSGASPEPSTFLDASENGNDVFFVTTSRLVGEDFDQSADVYDAHVCSAESSCQPPPPPPPVECAGDACQPPVQAPDDQTPGSLTFQGPGNLTPLASVPVKTKTTKKAVKCKKPKKLTHGKCAKPKKRAKKSNRASNDRRTGR